MLSVTTWVVDAYFLPCTTWHHHNFLIKSQGALFSWKAKLFIFNNSFILFWQGGKQEQWIFYLFTLEFQIEGEGGINGEVGKFRPK